MKLLTVNIPASVYEKNTIDTKVKETLLQIGAKIDEWEKE